MGACGVVNPRRLWSSNGGGWNGQNGSTFNYRGDGNGYFMQRYGPDMRVRDMNVSLARNGAVYLAFQV